MLPLSVVIIAKNEATMLPYALQSVAHLSDDILVCDTGSDDETVAVALANGARVAHQNWEGFGITKNKANQHAKYDWILQLDADEAADVQLIQNLHQINWNNTNVLYKIKRISFFKGKRIHYGAWKNDQQIRLFHRRKSSWNHDLVHERLIIEPSCTEQQLNGYILHKTLQSINQYRDKMNYYATQSAQQYFQQNKKGAWWKQYASPVFSFMRNYFVRLGFLDGKEGFTVAWLTAMYTHSKYAILQRLLQNKD